MPGIYLCNSRFTVIMRACVRATRRLASRQSSMSATRCTFLPTTAVMPHTRGNGTSNVARAVLPRCGCLNANHSTQVRSVCSQTTGVDCGYDFSVNPNAPKRGSASPRGGTFGSTPSAGAGGGTPAASGAANDDAVGAATASSNGDGDGGVATKSEGGSAVGKKHGTWAVDNHWMRLADPHTVSVVGAPMQYGQGLDGTEAAPDAFRDTGLLREITRLGWRVRDRGNVDIVSPSFSDPRGTKSQPRHSYAVGVSNSRLASAVYEAAGDGHFVLTLGGDHCIAIGSLGGALRARPSLGVIWVDAHADINAPEFSPSANAHGMPVAFLTKMVDVEHAPGYDWMADVPKLAADKLVYVGLRDLDDFEKNLVRKMGIKTFTMQHIDKYGIGKVMEMSLEHLCGKGEVPLHMSFDIDGCDPSIAPATGTRVPGGLNFRESSYVCEAVAETNLLVSMDMVEVNPLLSTRAEADATLSLATDLIKSSLGENIL